MAGSHINTTQHEEVEERLRERDEQYRSIFEATSDGIIINDLAGFVAEANPAASAMHGYSREDFIGLHRTAYVHPDVHPALPGYADTIEAGGSVHIRGMNVRRDCSTFPVEVHGSTFLYRGETHILAMVRDVTELVQAREAAAVEERARLARELHDSVTQALFSMTMHAEAAHMALERSARTGVIDEHGSLARNLRQLSELIDGALAEMRALIFELRPGALREEGLAAALRKHAAALSAREGPHVAVLAPEQRVDLDLSTEEHLYRLAQEALHNVVKHAAAAQAEVRVHAEADGRLVLEIEDDGRGFDPEQVPAGHLGLQTMADRVKLIRGVLQIQSAPGAGTTVRVTVRTADPSTSRAAGSQSTR
jgi:PAS domain S-box-containing protein